MPKNLWMLGRRRLAPTRSVFCPAWESVIARFTMVVVFPSCSVGLVSRKTLPGRSIVANWIRVRRLRNASATGDLGSKCDTRSAWRESISGSMGASAGRRSTRRSMISRVSMCGMTPRTGTPR